MPPNVCSTWINSSFKDCSLQEFYKFHKYYGKYIEQLVITRVVKNNNLDWEINTANMYLTTTETIEKGVKHVKSE